MNEAREGSQGARKMWRMKSCLKVRNSPVGFLSALGFTTLIHGMVVNGIMNVNISTIERRYHFRSYESGIISSSYDVAFCILCPLVTYYGNHSHRPRVIAAGLILFSLGCILHTTPHFVQEKYRIRGKYTDLCAIQNITPSFVQESEVDSSNFFLFIGGGILLGIGSIPIITLGVAYLEDSTTKERAASYIGLVGGLSAFGSVIGYLLGGYMLSYYVDFNKVDQSTLQLTPEDPLWVGAWWMSLLIATCLALLAMLLVSTLPKELAGRNKISANRNSEVHASSGSQITEQVAFGKKMSDFPIALKLLVKNPTFLFATTGASFESFLLNGFAVFLPKLLQNQFHISPTAAGLMAGSVSVPGAIIGHFASGYVVRKFSLRTPSILKAMAITTIISGLLTPCLLLHCPRNTSNTSNTLRTGQNLSCNRNCHCDQNLFLPVCGEDGVEYFSACDAGCHEQSNDSLVFNNCSCVPSPLGDVGSAKKGMCSTKCDLLILFLIWLFVLVTLSFAVLTPSIVVILRCVPYSQKSFAVGIQWFFIRVIGSIPSPLVIGAVIDACCAIWRMRDGNEDSCWLYDSKSFSQSAFLIAVVCKVLSVTCYAVAYRCYKTEQSDCNERGKSDGYISPFRQTKE